MNGNIKQYLARIASRGVQRAQSALFYSYNLIGVGGPVTTGDKDFFTVAMGGVGQGYSPMTPRETNLEVPRQLPQSSAWLIQRFGFAFDAAATLGDIETLSQSGYIWYDKTSYRYIYGEPLLWPGGVGISGATADATTPTQAWSNGLPSPTAMRRLDEPILLPKSDTFAFHLNVTKSGLTVSDGGVETKFLLEGINLTNVVDT